MAFLYGCQRARILNVSPSGGNGSNVTVHFAVYLDGSASMTCGTQQHPLHTPYLYLTVGSNSAAQTGASVCYSCYISSTLEENYNELIGTPFDVRPETDVQCTFGGVFFNWYDLYQSEGAYTFVQNAEPNLPTQCGYYHNLYIDGSFHSELEQMCHYWVQNWCTNTPDADYGTGPFYIALASADVQGVSPATGMKGWWLDFWILLWRVKYTNDWHTNVFLKVFDWTYVLQSNQPYWEALQYTLRPQPSTSYQYPKGQCTGTGGTPWVAPNDPGN